MLKLHLQEKEIKKKYYLIQKLCFIYLGVQLLISAFILMSYWVHEN